MTDKEIMQQWLQPGAIVSVDTKTVRILLDALRERLAQPEQDVPATCFGNMVPVGWLESPDGAFRANPLYKIKFPSKLLSWQVPLYAALPQPEQEPVVWVLPKIHPVMELRAQRGFRVR